MRSNLREVENTFASAVTHCNLAVKPLWRACDSMNCLCVLELETANTEHWGYFSQTQSAKLPQPQPRSWGKKRSTQTPLATHCACKLKVYEFTCHDHLKEVHNLHPFWGVSLVLIRHQVAKVGYILNKQSPWSHLKTLAMVQYRKISTRCITSFRRGHAVTRKIKGLHSYVVCQPTMTVWPFCTCALSHTICRVTSSAA